MTYRLRPSPGLHQTPPFKIRQLEALRQQ